MLSADQVDYAPNECTYGRSPQGIARDADHALGHAVGTAAICDRDHPQAECRPRYGADPSPHPEMARE